MVQVMTYLVENEQAALVVPARFVGRIHPHFREVVQLLAVQMADEARHMEVFSRRALLRGAGWARRRPAAGSRCSPCVAESDFALASFLLSVLGEGSFVDLLAFLRRHAPDPVTRRICRLARQDERRHVVFGMAHLEHQATVDPRAARPAARRDPPPPRRVDRHRRTQRGRLRRAGPARGGKLGPRRHRGRKPRRCGSCSTTWTRAGSAGSSRLGFRADEAAALSALHTRNFM